LIIPRHSRRQNIKGAQSSPAGLIPIKEQIGINTGYGSDLQYTPPEPAIPPSPLQPNRIGLLQAELSGTAWPSLPESPQVEQAETSRTLSAESPTQQTINLAQGESIRRNFIRQQKNTKRSNQFHSRRKIDRVITRPFKRSLIRHPGSIILPSPPGEPAEAPRPELPELPQAEPAETIVQQKTKSGPSNRSLIPPPRSTILSSSSQNGQAPLNPLTSEHPSSYINQTSLERHTLIDWSQASQLQELVLNQMLDTQQRENISPDERRIPHKPTRERNRPPGSPRGRSRSKSPSPQNLDSRNRYKPPTDGWSRSPVPSRVPPHVRSPPRAKATRVPSKRSPIHPPQNQTLHHGEMLPLLSEGLQTPRRSERLRLLSEGPQTPRRSERLRLLSERLRLVLSQDPSNLKVLSQEEETLRSERRVGQQKATEAFRPLPPQNPAKNVTRKVIQTNPGKIQKRKNRSVTEVTATREVQKAIPAQTRARGQSYRSGSPKRKGAPASLLGGSYEPPILAAAERSTSRNEEHQDALGIVQASDWLPAT
jgi:hypothetical protein